MRQTPETVMRLATLTLAALLLLAGCVSDGQGNVAPVTQVQQVSDLKGEGVIGPVQLGQHPFVAYLTAPLKWWGTGTVTVRYPTKPHVVVDGDLGFIIEPLYPQERGAIQASIARGDLQIRVAGRPAGLTR